MSERQTAAADERRDGSDQRHQDQAGQDVASAPEAVERPQPEVAIGHREVATSEVSRNTRLSGSVKASLGTLATPASLHISGSWESSERKSTPAPPPPERPVPVTPAAFRDAPSTSATGTTATTTSASASVATTSQPTATTSRPTAPPRPPPPTIARTDQNSDSRQQRQPDLTVQVQPKSADPTSVLYPDLTGLREADALSTTSGFFSDGSTRPRPSAPLASSSFSSSQLPESDADVSETESSADPKTSESSSGSSDETDPMDLAEQGLTSGRRKVRQQLFSFLHVRPEQKGNAAGSSGTGSPGTSGTSSSARSARQRGKASIGAHVPVVHQSSVQPVPLVHAQPQAPVLLPLAAFQAPQADDQQQQQHVAPQQLVGSGVQQAQQQQVAVLPVHQPRQAHRGRQQVRRTRSSRSRKRPRSRYVESEESLSPVDDEAGFPSRISPRNKKPFQGYTNF